MLHLIHLYLNLVSSDLARFQAAAGPLYTSLQEYSVPGLRTTKIGPDARNYRQNLQRKTAEALKTTMTALATHVQNISQDDQHSVYTGFSTTATSADSTINAHHYQPNYAFGGEMNRCTCWYEFFIEYTGEDMEIFSKIKKLETFFINQTPKELSQNKNEGGGGSAGGWLLNGTFAVGRKKVITLAEGRKPPKPYITLAEGRKHDT